MLAKAGEGDRAIKTKMVRFSLVLNYILPNILPFSFLYLAQASVRREAQSRENTKKMNATRRLFPFFWFGWFYLLRCTLVRLSFTIASCIS